MVPQKFPNYSHAYFLLKYKQALWIVHLSWILIHCLHFDSHSTQKP